jgi:UDP-GlcNAc:undecaprenyl-phosphate GlcNAc-1-phosphate transferase
MTTAILAAVVVSALSPVVVAVLGRRGVVDVPGSRTLHEIPTPRGGGLAVAPAITVAALLTVDLSAQIVVILGGALALALVGLVDDLTGLPALPRLGFQIAASLAVALVVSEGVVPWPLLAIPAGAFACVYYVNAFNFMDGINGISVAQTTVAGVHLAFVGRLIGIDEITVVGLAATGSALAFAPWNAPRARMFLGDVGSYFLGFLLSATALAAVISGAPVLLVVAPFSLYLLDTATTLALRIARGARITEAHREHAFQRLVTQGRSHIYVSSVVVVACALSSVVVLIADGSGTAIETLVGLVAWAPAIGFVLAGHRAKVGADA